MPTNDREAIATNGPFVVGGVGHRVLDSRLVELEAEIRNELQSIIDDHGACADRIRLIVSVAEGADRILIEAAIDLGIPYVCVLPCSPVCFAEDFPTVESVETFQRQLALAIDIVGPAEDPADRLDGYLWVSQYLLDHADVLIAIWDGEDGNGKAGTADTVETAIRRNIPVIWISADAPHEAVPYEPLAIGRE